MFRKSALILAFTVFGAIAFSAQAGDVRLVSDTWDNICKVEVMWGTNAPERGSSETFTNVPKGWYITKSSRICYRRSGDPDNCSSSLTQWHCSSNPASGTDKFSLY